MIEWDWFWASAQKGVVFPRSFETDESAEAAARKKFMIDNVQKLVDFIKMFKESNIFDTSSPTKSPFREELNKIFLIANVVASQTRLQTSDLDELEFAKNSLVKNRTSAFYNGFTIFPLGLFIVDSTQKAIQECRQDQLVYKELVAAGEYAASIGVIKKEAMIKDKGQGEGEFEILVPNSSKFADMAAKLFLFNEGASSALKLSSTCIASCHEIETRIEEVRCALFEAVATKFELKFKNLNGILEKCPQGLNEDQLSECCQEIQKLIAFHPCPKFQSAKLLGKECASEIEETMSSLCKIAKMLQSAVPKLAKMGHGLDDAGECLFMNQVVMDLFAALSNQDTCCKITKFAPVLKNGFDSVKVTIMSAVSAWVSKTAATFQSFLGALLDTEIVVTSILKSEIVGNVEAETDEGVDWCGVYVGFVQHDQRKKAKIHVKMNGETKTMDLHIAFLCLAGSLLQVAKYSYLVTTTLVDVEKAAVFKTMYENEFAEKKKTNPAIVDKSKLDYMMILHPHLTKLSKAVLAFESILSKISDGIGYMDNINDFWKKLMETIRGVLQKYVQEMFGELDSIKTGIMYLFDQVKGKHDLLDLFQKDKLPEAGVASLVADEDVSLLLFLGGKAGPTCAGINTFATAMTHMPKDVIITSTLNNLLVSLLKDLAAFASEQNPKVFPQDQSATLSSVSWFQGSLTLAQVLTRKLAPGETRLGLVGRCLKLLESKKMGVEPSLKQKASQFKDGK